MKSPRLWKWVRRFLRRKSVPYFSPSSFAAGFSSLPAGVPTPSANIKKMINARTILQNCPLGALARLGLTRAYVLSNDAPKAKSTYQEFFTLWKDADPDIPIFITAKAEYSKLK